MICIVTIKLTKIDSIRIIRSSFDKPKSTLIQSHRIELNVFTPNKIPKMPSLIILYALFPIRYLMYIKQIIPAPIMISNDLLNEEVKAIDSSQGISIKIMFPTYTRLNADTKKKAYKNKIHSLT